MRPRTLSPAQLHALAMCRKSPNGSLWVGDGIGLGADKASRAVAAVTARSLDKLGLVKFHNASGHRPMGIGCWACYRITAEGRALVLIGQMLKPLISDE